MQLPDPPRVKQGSQLKCWAAAIAATLEATGSGPRSVDAIIGHVRGKTKAVIDGNGALRVNPPNYNELVEVVGLFGMNFERFYSAQQAAARPGAKTFSLEAIRTRVQQKKYSMLIYKDPTWVYDGGGAWHCVVAYGVDGEDFLQVMDPDGGRLATMSVIADFEYFLADRESGKPWSP